MSTKIYGFGIVDKNGHPWWDETCVCQDRQPMDDIVAELNEKSYDYDGDDRRPFRTVRLIFAVRRK